MTVLAAISLVTWLYFGAVSVPPKKENSPIQAGLSATKDQPHAAKPASIDSLKTAAYKQLPAHAASSISDFENQLSAIRDSSQMAVLFDSLAGAWRAHKQMPLAAYYYLLAGKLANSEKKITFAAQLFLELAKRSTDASVQQWELNQAIEGFNRVLATNATNDTAQLGLAECYIGSGSTMQGVLLLREITTRNPNHVPANLILGQQGIVSGQFEKAIGRFERVLGVEPDNVEAILGLSEAYKNTGAKEKAIALLERAKKSMNNPEFSKDVDAYMKTIK